MALLWLHSQRTDLGHHVEQQADTCICLISSSVVVQQVISSPRSSQSGPVFPCMCLWSLLTATFHHLPSNCKIKKPESMQARKKFPMMAEFAQRINCGGATAHTTSAFMREMMQSSTRISYDNILALQTFGDDDEDEETVSLATYWWLHAQQDMHTMNIYTCIVQCAGTLPLGRA